MLSVETSFCSGFDVATVTDALIKKNMKTILIHIFVLLFCFVWGFFHYGVLFFSFQSSVKQHVSLVQQQIYAKWF